MIAVIALIAFRPFIKKGPWYSYAATGWTSLLDRWDAVWYINIARHGYFSLQAHVFYPAFPLLIRVFAPVLGWPTSALALSWLAAIIATWGIIDVTKRYTSLTTARWAGVLFLWNPVSIFLIAGYAEALLAAAMIWTLRFCLDQQWWKASLVAAIASCTMPQGCTSGLVIILAVVLLERDTRGLCRGLFYGILGELGLIAYFVYCWRSTGNAFISFRAGQKFWSEHVSFPFYVLVALWQRITSRYVPGAEKAVYLLDAFACLLGAGFIIFSLLLAWRHKEHLLPAVLLTASVLISITAVNENASAASRYILCLAPLYVVAAVALERIVATMRSHIAVDLLLVSASMATIFGLMFNLGWWVT